MQIAAKSLFWILLITLAAPFASAQEPAKPKPVTFHWKKKEAGQVIEILLVEVPFKKSLHKIEAGEGNVARKIDGVDPWGTDGMIPQTELATFTVKWNGKDVPVPEPLWKDCFNLHIQPHEEPEFPEPGDVPFVKVSDDGRYAIFTFEGSDGAGAYAVTWILSRDGRHSRWTTSY